MKRRQKKQENPPMGTLHSAPLIQQHRADRKRREKRLGVVEKDRCTASMLKSINLISSSIYTTILCVQPSCFCHSVLSLQEMSHLETVPNQPPAPNHGPLMGFDLKATGPESGQFCLVSHTHNFLTPPFLNSL